MVYVHLVQHVVAEQVGLAVAHVEGVDLALDDEGAERSAAAGHCQFGVLLVELVVQLEEGLVHEHLDHLVEVTCLVQQLGPLSDPAHQVLLNEQHAFRSPVPIQHCEQADELPLAASDVFLDDEAVLHSCPEADVLAESGVEPGHLEGEVAELDLAVEGEWHVAALLDFAEYFVGRHQGALDHLPDRLVGAEDEVRVAADVERLPPDLDRQLLQGLAEEVNVKTPVLSAFLVPVLGFVADSAEFVDFLGVEGVALEVVVVGCVELGECLDAVVLEHIADVGESVDGADLFDFVDGFCEVEADQVRPDGIELAVPDLHSLLGDVEPGARFAAEVQHIEAFEAVVLQLGVLRCQSHSLNLQSQPIQLDISRTKYLPLGVGRDEQYSVFVDPVNALQSVLERQFLYFGDVDLEAGIVEVILGYRVNFVLCVFGWVLADGFLLGEGFALLAD